MGRAGVGELQAERVKWKSRLALVSPLHLIVWDCVGSLDKVQDEAKSLTEFILTRLSYFSSNLS